MQKDPGKIRIKDYLYDLPDERIAQYPLAKRDSSKLLVWNGAKITDRVFKDLPEILDNGILIVFNNTRVIRARLLFRKESGAAIEVFCLEPLKPVDFSVNLSSGPGVEWKCLVGNLKRWKEGSLTASFTARGSDDILKVEKTGRDGDAFRIRFEWGNENLSFSEVLEAMGHVPIPPYINRPDEESDRNRYQTVYARVKGSVAAPTAGLHFTADVLKSLAEHNIDTDEITLHVSAGTFRPVKSELIADHQMHTEHFYVSTRTLKRLLSRKIIAVGTTTVRTLESIYWLGAGIANGNEPGNEIPHIGQWQPYNADKEIDTTTAIKTLLSWMERKGKTIIEAKTDIIIIPGYRFRIINGMVTNFHQPGSTLLLLIAAFTGDAWKTIYDHALSTGYRFLSYGDSMLLTKSW